MSLYQIENGADDRTEIKNVESIYASLRYVSYVWTCSFFFFKLGGNGGKRGASHTVILFNPLSRNSHLNKISYSNIKGLSV